VSSTPQQRINHTFAPVRSKPSDTSRQAFGGQFERIENVDAYDHVAARQTEGRAQAAALHPDFVALDGAVGPRVVIHGKDGFRGRRAQVLGKQLQATGDQLAGGSEVQETAPIEHADVQGGGPQFGEQAERLRPSVDLLDRAVLR